MRHRFCLYYVESNLLCQQPDLIGSREFFFYPIAAFVHKKIFAAKILGRMQDSNDDRGRRRADHRTGFKDAAIPAYTFFCWDIMGNILDVAAFLQS